jgi:TonB family protein
MKFFKNIIYLLPIAGVLLFSSCNNEMASSEDETGIEADDYTPAAENRRAGVYPYDLTLDPKFNPNIDRYSYRLPKPVVTPENDEGANPDARMVKNTPDAYSPLEVDEAPVFGEACMNLVNPEDCTNDAIQEYFFNVISYPEEAKAQNQEGYYNVTFTLNENGEIGDDFRVIAKDNPCEGCAQAAVNAIAQMPDWKPAMKDGQPVAIELTLPVRFNYSVK